DVAAWQPCGGSPRTSSGDRCDLLGRSHGPGAEVDLWLWLPRSSISRSVTRSLREIARRAAVLHAEPGVTAQPGPSADLGDRRDHRCPVMHAAFPCAVAAHQRAATGPIG